MKNGLQPQINQRNKLLLICARYLPHLSVQSTKVTKICVCYLITAIGCTSLWTKLALFNSSHLHVFVSRDMLQEIDRSQGHFTWRRGERRLRERVGHQQGLINRLIYVCFFLFFIHTHKCCLQCCLQSSLLTLVKKSNKSFQKCQLFIS